MIAVAVDGRLARGGGKGDQRADIVAADDGEPARCRGLADRAGLDELLDERIVAAGVENEDHRLRAGRLKLAEDRPRGNRRERQAGGVADLGIDGQQVVLVADLNAMPGVINDDDGIRRDGLLELQHRPLEIGFRAVEERRHRKADRAQRVGDQLSVVDRILEFRNGVVVRVADDQGKPAAVARRDGRGGRNAAQPKNRNDNKAAAQAWTR